MAKKLVDKCPVDIESYYSEYIDIKNQENTDSRYVGKEKYYHASGIGTCSRKLYYQSVMKAKPTNKVDFKS